MNSQEKVRAIKEERVEMLKRVLNALKQNKESVSNNIDSVLKIVEFDEKNVRKYESIVKAKQIIEELTMQIIDSNSHADIAKLRNRLNYYINKIKKELQNRNVSDTMIDSYTNNMTDLRGDIAKYIRYLKRNEKLIELEYLSDNYDDLTKEQKDEFKKTLKNEKAFDKRFLQNTPVVINNPVNDVEATKTGLVLNIPSKEEVEINDSLYISTVPETSLNDKLVFSPSTIGKTIIDVDVVKEENNSVVAPLTYNVDNNYQSNSEDEFTFYKKRSNIYNSKYNMIDIYKYNKSLKENVVKFFKNIPKYFVNKKRIKKMELDYNRYYRGEDLEGYIEYSRRRNSILQGLKSIFNKTYLFSGEGKYLNNHELCADWLTSFFSPETYENKVIKKVI